MPPKSVSKDVLTEWSKEGRQIKARRSSLLNDLDAATIGADVLFKTEPTWRGQRRKNLVQQRMQEAAEEEKLRKGKGKQDLWEAARVGNLEQMMEKLFRSKGFEASAKDLSHGIHAAAAHGREDVLDLLIRHGANPSDNDMPQGFTPLMVSAAKGKVHAVLLLIDRGADINAKNELGQTALHLAALNGHAHVIKALIAEGAQAWHEDKYRRRAVDCAQLDTEEHDRCRAILAQAKPKPRPPQKVKDVDDKDGKTPCHHHLVYSIHGSLRSKAADPPSNLA
mmetsp:Transcript_44132/g.90080  ORF Transcript_44132/g.90080 Transcript_44132/m.90080 type:complete len:280 (-) Transcript_44132:2349-3188(-)